MTLKNSPTRSTVLPVALLIIMVFAVCSRAERPETMGFAPAFPDKLPTFEPVGRPPLLTDWRDASFVLHLDNKGRVEKVAMVMPEDSSIYAHLSDYLDKLRFEPARLDGKKVASLLPITCRLEPRQPVPQLSFPIDTGQKVIKSEWYHEVLSLNDINMPSVTSFPSYNAGLVSAAESEICPYVLVQLNLDEDGRVVGRKKVLSNYDSYDDQVLSAILYAEFTPAAVKGRTVAATVYLLVSFYPFVTYPTAVYDASDTTVGSLWERRRLQLLLDTTGIMTVPVPRHFPADSISLGSRFTYQRDTLKVSMRVDRRGLASVSRTGQAAREIQQAAIQAVRSMQFYPAVDFRGETQSFTGEAEIEFTGSRSVRIHYHWLR